MITSFNFYYAQPGNEDAVLRQRLYASDVREKLAIPRGRVMRRTAGAATLPDAIWELQFAEIAGHHADMAVRAASPEFEAVRAGMRKLCRRFDRPLFEICADTLASHSQNARIVTLEWIFCAPDGTEKILDVLRRQINHDAPGRLAGGEGRLGEAAAGDWGMTAATCQYTPLLVKLRPGLRSGAIVTGPPCSRKNVTSLCAWSKAGCA